MGTKRRSYHRLDNKDFSTIKTLQEAGLPVSKIHEITGRSFGVLLLIKKSNSLNDYRKGVREVTNRYAKPTVKTVHEEIEEKNLVEKTTTVSEVVDALNKINTTLERLATAWESRPTKRGLFDR